MLTVGHIPAHPFSLFFLYLFLSYLIFTHLFIKAEVGEEEVTKDPKE